MFYFGICSRTLQRCQESDSANPFWARTVFICGLQCILHPLFLSFFVFSVSFFGGWGFSVALKAVLKLALVDKACLQHTEITCLCAPSTGISFTQYILITIVSPSTTRSFPLPYLLNLLFFFSLKKKFQSPGN